MQFINLTPHEITVQLDGEAPRIYESSGEVARVGVSTEYVGEIDGIPLVRSVKGEVVNLPAPQEGVTFIVSRMVRDEVSPSRLDVVCPDTGPDSVLRNEKGHVVGVRRFSV